MTLLILILILGLLIFIHEMGHFLAAKYFGVYVHEFALGMGPIIFSFKRKKKKDPTLYSLRLFPIGGSCAIAGEVNEDAEDIKLKKDEYMCNKTKLQRIIILLAGVTFNFVLAMLLLFFQALIWGTNEQKSIVGYAPEDYPVSQAGIEVGDQIVALNGYKIKTWDKLTVVLNLKNESNIYTFTVKKTDGTIKTYKLSPTDVEQENGKTTKVFGIGVGSEIHKGFGNAIKYMFAKFGAIVDSMYIIIISLFSGKLSLSSLSGPVGMYSIVGQSVSYGLVSIIYLTAYLSINLGFINAIPFPAFDGGRVLFIVIETITKKRINAKVENAFHTVGFLLLMLLMVYITIQDVVKLF